MIFDKERQTMTPSLMNYKGNYWNPEKDQPHKHQDQAQKYRHSTLTQTKPFSSDGRKNGKHT
jgi:hypothetical protein